MVKQWQDRGEALFSFVGENCCNTTVFDNQQFKSVGVGLIFHSFVGVTFTSFVGPTVFNPEANHTLSTLTDSVNTTGSGMAKVLSRIAGKSAQKVGTSAQKHEKVGTILPLPYQPLCHSLIK